MGGEQGDLRLAIYSQDGLGLGHLRRNTLIGKNFLDRVPDSNVLLLADSPVAPFFRMPAGMDHLKLPSIRKVKHGHWEPTSLRIGDGELRRLRANILRDTLRSFSPHLLLVDHMPGGACGEMIPALEILRQDCRDCTIVLGLRDILDAQEVIARVWHSEGAYEALQRYYDGILIYGAEEVFDTGRVYGLPVPRRGIHYCGYVVNQEPVRPRAEVLKEAGVAGRRMVFVSVGGGGDGLPLLETYVEAVRALGDRADFWSLISLGANSAAGAYERMRTESAGLPISVIPYTGDSFSHIAAADLVVSMAGYNTICEVLYLQKKALVVPRPGPSAEQRMRATLLAKRGLLDMLDPRELSPASLGERLLADLARDDYPAPKGALRMGGAERAADHLVRFVSAKAYVAA